MGTKWPALRILAATGMAMSAGAAAASPMPTAAGANYSLLPVTLGSGASAASTAQIVQLAFQPGDTGHLYATRLTGAITRFDYAPSGNGAIISNATDIVTSLNGPYGLAFDGNDLYFSLNPFSGGRSTGQIDLAHRLCEV